MNFFKVGAFLALFILVPSVYAQERYIPIERKSVSAKIEDFLKSDVFKMSSSEFEKEWLKKFALDWTDKFKRSARGTQKVSYYDITSKETLFKFRSKLFNQATLMIYNQGDEGAFTKTKFEALLKESHAKIQKSLGVKGGFKPGNAKLDNRNIYFWVKMPYLYRLEFSSSMAKPAGNKFAAPKFKAEYIRLIVSKGDPRISAVNVDRVGANNLLTGAEIKEMVTKDKDGGVFVDGVPMVDQGQKGYCACATTARILNYYGRDIDQHDIAKMALSSGDGGTNPEKLKKAITKIASSLRLNMKTVVKCPISSEREYNRMWSIIKREFKKKDLPVKQSAFGGFSVKKADLTIVFESMSKKDSRFKTFMKGVKSSIDRGRPLAWALRLGIVIEPDIPQADGGHMRLIIGYNESTDEIYYSDSWGAKHELKKMKAWNAFYTSMALWEISPR